MEKISIFDVLREEGVLREADEDQAAAAEEQPAAPSHTSTCSLFPLIQTSI